MTEKEILEKRNEVFQAQRALGQRIQSEGRGFNDEERAQFEKSEIDYRQLTDQLEAYRAVKQKQSDKVEEEYRAKHEAGSRAPKDNERMGESQPTEYPQVFKKWLAHGERSMTPDDYQTAKQYRAQAKGTGAAGGFITPEHWDGELITKMKRYGGMMEAATVIRTDDGNIIYHPVVSDVDNIGEILGENVAATEQDVPFGQVAIGAHKYSSKIVLVSMELAQDETYGLEGVLTNAFARRIGVIANQHFTSGDGVNKPNGIITDIPAGLNYTGSVADGLTRPDIIRTKGLVDPAYRVDTAGFMLNDSTLTEIKLLTVGSGDDRPLWNPSMREGAPDTIDGSRYFINQQMAGLGASNVSLLYGDFSQYLIRISRDVSIFRFGEKYMDQGSFGYLSFARMDGKLIDNSAVAKLTNAAA